MGLVAGGGVMKQDSHQNKLLTIGKIDMKPTDLILTYSNSGTLLEVETLAEVIDWDGYQLANHVEKTRGPDTPWAFEDGERPSDDALAEALTPEDVTSTFWALRLQVVELYEGRLRGDVDPHSLGDLLRGLITEVLTWSELEDLFVGYCGASHDWLDVMTDGTDTDEWGWREMWQRFIANEPLPTRAAMVEN